VSGSSKLTKITDGAVSFDGSGDYLSVGASADFEFGSGDFTVEAFVNPTTTSTSNMVFASGNGGVNGQWYIWGNGGVWLFGTYISTIPGNRITGSSIVTNTWTHLAVVKSGNDFKLYVNGTQSGSTYTGSGDYGPSGYDLNIGRQGTSGNDFTGFISNVRVIKGTALYTENFTPPSAPITDVTNTKLLCCQSNTSAGAAAVSPNLGGVNDGTVWSESLSNQNTLYNTSSVGNGVDGFDGDTSTYVMDWDGVFNTNADYRVELILPTPISYSTSVRAYTIFGGGSPYSNDFFVDTGSGYGSAIDHVSNSWVTLASGSGTLHKIKSTGVQNGTGWSAIEIDGVILVDPVLRKGDAAATNFNPFTTDINAVRGQETGYATLNPLAKSTDATLSNGNLTFATTGTATYSNSVSTIGVSTGKWYYEFTTNSGPDHFWYNGWAQSGYTPTSDYVGATADSYGYSSYLGSVRTNGSQVVAYSTWRTVGDTIGFALDLDNGKMYFSKNGIWQGGSDPLQGTNAAASGLSGTWYAAVSGYDTTNGFINFGQNPFKFPPPEGFLPLNAANVRPSTVIARPDQYVGVTTYTGNQTARTLPLNFAADFVWTKRIDASNSHQLYDQTRGNGNYLQTDGTGQADTDSAAMSFGTNKGINLGSGTRSNETGVDYVAWAWKAGGGSGTAGQFWKDGIQYASAAAVPNFLTGSGIETTPDGCSIGTRQGFSIVTYAGDGSNAVIPHGLTDQPSFVIIKRRNGIKYWMIAYPSTNPSSQSATDVSNYLKFDTSTGTDVSPNQWLYTQSDRLIMEQSSQGHNESGGTYVAYCWHNVPGLQKFGRYIGTGVSPNYVHLGFRPALIIIKNVGTNGSPSNTNNWLIQDSKRNTYNQINDTLYPNLSDQEANSSSNFGIDFLSNGFALRTTGGYATNSNNASEGHTFIYAAFAEAPTFNLYGAQSNAR